MPVLSSEGNSSALRRRCLRASALWLALAGLILITAGQTHATPRAQEIANLLPNAGFDEGDLYWPLDGTLGQARVASDCPDHAGNAMRLTTGASEAGAIRSECFDVSGHSVDDIWVLAADISAMSHSAGAVTSGTVSASFYGDGSCTDESWLWAIDASHAKPAWGYAVGRDYVPEAPYAVQLLLWADPSTGVGDVCFDNLLLGTVGGSAVEVSHLDGRLPLTPWMAAAVALPALLAGLFAGRWIMQRG
jgi:hypothetical protein